jgi:hypothetical protein
MVWVRARCYLQECFTLDMRTRAAGITGDFAPQAPFTAICAKPLKRTYFGASLSRTTFRMKAVCPCMQPYVSDNPATAVTQEKKLTGF